MLRPIELLLLIPSLTLPEALSAQQPNREVAGDLSPNDLSWDVTGDPLFARKVARGFDYHMAGPWVNNRMYFPMAIQFVHLCSQVWNANCMHFDETQNVRVPLIPVLDNIEECSKIPDRAISEQCRQLNTYRAAFRQVETIAQVRVDKDLCRKVDQGPGTKVFAGVEGYSFENDAFGNIILDLE